MSEEYIVYPPSPTPFSISQTRQTQITELAQLLRIQSINHLSFGVKNYR